MTHESRGEGSHAGYRTSTALPLAGFCRKGWPDSARIGGRIPPEYLAGINRNTWPESIGIPGRFAPEYAGLTRLRKLAKDVGRNRELAQALWRSDVYDARVIALLIDDPAKITREQAELQVEQLGGGMLAHVFASCDATLAKTSFVPELADQWVRSADAIRRECGYGLLYEASKFSGKKAPADEYFLEHVSRIDHAIDAEPESVRMAMGAALMGIGKRNAVLNAAALKVARRVGPIEFTSASGNCEPFDVVKHLTTDRLKEKLGVQ